MRRTNQGFTLIEMLVVVAVISILAAIMFPVFARARENARRASCMSNLKQIGLSQMMYMQDYDEHYPAYRASSTDNWWIRLQPYIKSQQIFYCPSSRMPWPDNKDPKVGNYIISHEINTNDGLSVAAIISPATTYMITEGSAGYQVITVNNVKSPNSKYAIYLSGTGPGSASNLPESDPWYSAYPALEDDFKSGRHFGGVNMTFADGHVKWLQSNDIIVQARNSSNGAWNPLVDNS